jgi:hypothetical protein
VDIFSAVERKNLRALRRILKNDPGAACASDCWGRTALMLSCIEGEDAFVSLLLPFSEARSSDRDGETALMLAAFGHPRCVELLLPLSDPMACDNDGWTALMWAASSGSERCIDLLLPHSDVNAATSSGLTALDIARAYAREAQAQQIRRHMLATRTTDMAGSDTPLAMPGAPPASRITPGD